MSGLRKLFPIALMAIIAGCGSAPAADETYPSRLVKVILPFPPGSTLDALSRVMTDQMAQKWGQPVVIENITGGGGNIGTDRLRARRPTATPCCSARRDRSPSTR
jgi:tripartite-type tricarboxylate transporter receptor subunit TctC